MEAQLWKATWKQVGRGYVVGLAEHPRIQASASSLDEAIDMLEELIADELHDPVPHLEFLKPLPQVIGGRGQEHLFVLAAHSEADEIPEYRLLFKDDRCRDCGNWASARSEALIQLASRPTGDLVFTDILAQVFSERLAKFLKLDECPDIQLRPTILAGKETMEFREVWSKRPRQYVAKRGVRASRGFRCKSCGFTVWMYMPFEAKFLKYICVDDLPSPKRPVFPIGINDQMSIAVSRTVRDAVIKSKRFKGVASRPVGLLVKGESSPIDSFFAS